jgi:hypothetical protein
MFRSRFNEVLPAKLSHFGPQDIERGVTDQPPSPQVEGLLCALLGLVLNRKKPVEYGTPARTHGGAKHEEERMRWERDLRRCADWYWYRRGHHGRALEEAVLSQKAQWPHSWQGVNPLHGNRDFNIMSPTERVSPMPMPLSKRQGVTC